MLSWEDVYQTLQARQLLAMRLYRGRALSLGQAARLAGSSRWDFIELLSENDIPVVDYTDDELEAEFAAVARLKKDLEAGA